ncbi:hypothetical protein [Arthrobacter sp. S2(2024)]|uniref:hypothetical protein n=1 Tax=Arthrobacter sp. S2(2024) TaxID=3111911 RepID=UPI002FCA4223
MSWGSAEPFLISALIQIVSPVMTSVLAPLLERSLHEFESESVYEVVEDHRRPVESSARVGDSLPHMYRAPTLKVLFAKYADTTAAVTGMIPVAVSVSRISGAMAVYVFLASLIVGFGVAFWLSKMSLFRYKKLRRLVFGPVSLGLAAFNLALFVVLLIWAP